MVVDTILFLTSIYGDTPFSFLLFVFRSSFLGHSCQKLAYFLPPQPIFLALLMFSIIYLIPKSLISTIYLFSPTFCRFIVYCLIS